MSNERWRVVMLQETGERVQYGERTFSTSEAACIFIEREQLDDLHPECRFYVEPDILQPCALHLDMCASQDDTMAAHPNCELDEARAFGYAIDAYRMADAMLAERAKP